MRATAYRTPAPNAPPSDFASPLLPLALPYPLPRGSSPYHRHEVPHYRILDPATETLAVHSWTQPGYLNMLPAARGERIRAEPFDAVQFDLGELFGDADDA